MTTDDGWITDSISTIDTFSLDYDRESFDILEPGTFDNLIEFVIRKSTYETIFTRKYKKIQNVLAEMTGFLQIIFFFLYIISSPFIKKEYYETLTNSLYNFELDENDLKTMKNQRKIKRCSTLETGEKLKNIKTLINTVECKNENLIEIGNTSQINTKKKRSDDKLVNYFFKMKENPLNLTMTELVKSLFVKKPKLLEKINQRKTGISNILSQLDLKFILKKFAEIDKIKMLLLNEDQYHLFEYLPKPVILKNSKIHINYVKDRTNSPVKKDEIIQHNDVLLKARTIQKAYINIIKKDKLNEIDNKLIQSLDEDIGQLLASTYKDSVETARHPSKRKTFSLDFEQGSVFSEKKNEIHIYEALEMKSIKKI